MAGLVNEVPDSRVQQILGVEQMAGYLARHYDEEIWGAIANPTLGNPLMDGLSCIVLVADALEPVEAKPRNSNSCAKRVGKIYSGSHTDEVQN